MDAEQIVRALAANPRMGGGQRVCLLCGQGGLNASGVHAPTCPWRLAREWVAANPTVVLATASAPLFDDDPSTN